MHHCVWNSRNGERLGTQVRTVLGFWERLCGLATARYLPLGTGLYLPRCRAVHTHFMRVNLDLLYLDEVGRVLAIRRGVRPWRAPGPVAGTVGILEVPAGAAGATMPGDRLLFAPRGK
jgi:uncharacterized membrane protein (UPF0127 family)